MDRNKPDLRKVEVYEQIMDTAVEEKRAWLSGMGFSLDDRSCLYSETGFA